MIIWDASLSNEWLNTPYDNQHERLNLLILDTNETLLKAWSQLLVMVNTV